MGQLIFTCAGSGMSAITCLLGSRAAQEKLRVCYPYSSGAVKNLAPSDSDAVTKLHKSHSETIFKNDKPAARNWLPEYQPENGIDDLVWRRRSGEGRDAGLTSVVKFPIGSDG